MKIMFVCTGNTCRSAMAHHMLEKMVKEKDNVEVYSCGIYADSGEPATYSAIDVMKEYGVDMNNHRARNIKETKIEQMDLILCATVSHKQLVLNMYPELIGKVYTLKEYVGIGKEGKNMDIKDPWGCNIETYKQCAEEIKQCLEMLIDNNSKKGI